MLCTSAKRRQNWIVENTISKSLLTTMGMITYHKTCFRHKVTKEHRYLLDDITAMEAHARMTEDVEAKRLEQVVDCSYEKTGKMVVRNEKISKQTIKNKLEKLEIPLQLEKREKNGR